MVLLPDTAQLAATLVAGRIVETIRAAGEAFDRARSVTASAGVACATKHDAPIEILRRADEGAYSAKAAGGDRVIAPAA